MTTFTDGPAKGTKLMLGRAPKMLRVTEVLGVFDALNELDDVPRPEEKLYCYVMSKFNGTCHINRAGGRGGFYAIAEYALRPVQPTDAEMRSNKLWAAWCDKTPEAAEIRTNNELSQSA